MIICSSSLQALFAGSIPEIIDIVKTFPKYSGTYMSDRGRRHVTLPTRAVIEPSRSFTVTREGPYLGFGHLLFVFALDKIHF